MEIREAVLKTLVCVFKNWTICGTEIYCYQ